MPNIFWIDLKKVDLSKETGKILKLDLGKNQSNTYIGEVNSSFHIAEPMKFL